MDSAPGALKALKSMWPRMASVLFAQAVDAIRRGRIGRVIRAIATSRQNRAQPIILAAKIARGDAEFEALLRLYTKLNEAEVGSENTPSTSAKAEGLAHVIRRLTTIQRVAALRQMFGQIELKPSARDIVVALLTNGDVDDVTTVLLKIGNITPRNQYVMRIIWNFASLQSKC